MTTSGSIDFSMTGGEIVSAALRVNGALGEEETASAQQMTDGLQALNRLIKRWKARGINLWLYEELIIFLQVGKQSYSIGATGDQATTSGDYIKTEIATAASSGASSIEVDSITGIASGDVIGVVVDDGSIHWTTVNGAPSGATITLTDVLDDDVAVDNHVYTYTTIANRPLRILDARLQINDGNEVPMVKISRSTYDDLPTKSTQGNPSQFYYNPTLTNGTLKIWTTAQSSNDVIRASVQRQIEDFDATTNTPDMPQEWYDPLVFNLAVSIAPEYGVTGQKLIEIKTLAIEFLEDVEGWDVEFTSISMMPSDEDVEGWE